MPSFFNRRKCVQMRFAFLTILTTFLLAAAGLRSFGQGTSINNSGAAPHSSAMLDVSATDKGVLVPRMTASQRSAITSPAAGLLVYQTDGSAGFWYYTGSGWSPVAGGGPSGNNPGDLQYWDGSQWQIIPVGLPGQQLTLSASGLPQWQGPTYPAVTTAAATGIGGTIAISGGQVTSDGGQPVTARGVCWSTSPNPTLANTYKVSGTGTGTFTTYLDNLQTSTLYYARAFATSSIGTSYGNQISFTTAAQASIAIGEFYEGGYIAYVDNSGLHGLIVAPTDQSSGAEWGCYTSFLGITSTDLGNGPSNTGQIVSSCPTPGIAAALCNDLVLGGYSDWYLPTRDELNLAYQNLHLFGIGGFAAAHYWTSSEVHAWSSWFVRFSDGYVDWNTRDQLFPVRAFRSF